VLASSCERARQARTPRPNQQKAAYPTAPFRLWSVWPRASAVVPSSLSSPIAFPERSSHPTSAASRFGFRRLNPNDRNAEPCAAANRLRGHRTCGRPPPPFHPPAGAAPAPPVAELGVVRKEYDLIVFTLTVSFHCFANSDRMHNRSRPI